jgi:hypothetical protein
VQIGTGVSRRPSAIYLNVYIGKSPGKAFCLFVVEKKAYEFYARGAADTVKDFEKVIANDRMLARGHSPRAVALCFYAITAALGVAAWLSLEFGWIWRSVIWGLTLAGTLIFAMWLGALTEEHREIRLDRAAGLAASKGTGVLP